MRTQMSCSDSCALLQPSPVPALLKPKNRISTQQPSESMDETGNQPGPYHIAPRITHVDRTIIRRYFKKRANNSTILTRAPARSEPRRPWTMNQPLPAELRTSLLPGELEEKLSALEIGYERVRAGDDVLLVEAGTRTIVDALVDL